MRLSADTHQTDFAVAARLRQSAVLEIETEVRQISCLELRRWLAATHFDMASFDTEFDARLERLGLTHSLTGP